MSPPRLRVRLAWDPPRFNTTTQEDMSAIPRVGETVVMREGVTAFRKLVVIAVEHYTVHVGESLAGPAATLFCREEPV